MRTGKIVLAMVSTFLTLGLIEIVLRLTIENPVQVSPATIVDAELGWRFQGNALTEVNDLHREVRIRHYTNSMGFNDAEHEMRRPQNARRILFIGDSFTDGGHVPLDSHFVKVIEGGLTADGNKWECINAGLAGYGTAQEIKMYEKIGRAFDPDIVVLGFCVDNDISDNHPRLASQPVRPYYLRKDGALVFQAMDTSAAQASPKLNLKRRHHPAVEWLYKTYFWNVKRSAMVRLRARLKESPAITSTMRRLGFWKEKEYIPWHDFVTALPADQAAAWDEAFEITAEEIELFRKTVEADGRKFFVFLIPSRIQVYEDWLKSAELFFSNFKPETLDMERPNKFLSARLFAGRIMFVDLLPEFRRHKGPSRLYFKNDGHWTAEGHRETARILLEKLKALGWTS